MLTEHELNNLNKGLYFNKKYLISNGSGGYVYKINDKYVVKHMCFYKTWKYVKKEFDTTIVLSMSNIAPKVIYHSKSTDKFKYFVMEKLDYTAHSMIKSKRFTEFHLGKLKNIFNLLNKTNFIHADLHLKNIMWSNYYKEFRIIDWEYYYKTNKYINYSNFINKVNYIMNNEYYVYKILGYTIYKTKCLTNYL